MDFFISAVLVFMVPLLTLALLVEAAILIYEKKIKRPKKMATYNDAFKAFRKQFCAQHHWQQIRPDAMPCKLCECSCENCTCEDWSLSQAYE
jgi:hypothetical protein